MEKEAETTADMLIQSVTLMAKTNITALTVISQQLYTLELQLGDALADQTHIRYTNKCLRDDKQLVETLVKLNAVMNNINPEEEEEDGNQS